jgi:hypothetical protein
MSRYCAIIIFDVVAIKSNTHAKGGDAPAETPSRFTLIHIPKIPRGGKNVQASTELNGCPGDLGPGAGSLLPASKDTGAY